jgi:molybdopterin-guanine dinucleotide biosynthesis protein A
MNKIDGIVGVILAGGQSRRMAGRDKRIMPLAGQPLIAHVIERFAPQIGPLILNVNGDPKPYGEFGLPIAPDTIDGFLGPLAGVLAGMDWALVNAPQCHWIATAAADTPFFPMDFVAQLAEASEASGALIARAASLGRAHPTFAIWSVSLASDLRSAIADAGVRKATEWTTQQGCATVSFDASDFDPFFNINTPDDLLVAEAHLENFA